MPALSPHIKIWSSIRLFDEKEIWLILNGCSKTNEVVEKKFFKWNHTLEENRERLENEKRQGFQIEEFIIDDAPRGEWLINVQYLGQEDDYILPPFLKYTLYRDYGTPSETKEVRVIKLFRQTEKVTLAKLEI